MTNMQLCILRPTIQHEDEGFLVIPSLFWQTATRPNGEICQCPECITLGLDCLDPAYLRAAREYGTRKKLRVGFGIPRAYCVDSEAAHIWLLRLGTRMNHALDIYTSSTTPRRISFLPLYKQALAVFLCLQCYWIVGTMSLKWLVEHPSDMMPQCLPKSFVLRE